MKGRTRTKTSKRRIIWMATQATLIFILIGMQNPLNLAGQEKNAGPPWPSSVPGTLAAPLDAPHGGNGIDCASCHVLHSSPGGQLTAVAGNPNLCMSCHNPAGLASAKPFADADRAVPGTSGTSHAWSVPADNPQHGASLPTNAEMAVRVYDGNIVCSTCHNQHSQEFTPFLRASNFQNSLCKDCHAIRDLSSYRDDPNNRGSHPVGKPYPASDPRFHNAPQDPNLVLVDPDRVECTTCHNVHYTDSGGANGGTGDGYLLRTTNDNTLCQSCHTYGQHNGMNCLDCHQPHDPARSNILLVRNTVSTPNSGSRQVIFIAESGQNSFADGDSNYDGICEVCHSSTAYHRNNSSGDHAHNVATNCTACHTHEAGFSINCLSCHNQPQGNRRQIVGTQGDFNRNSHHVNGQIANRDCATCHNLGAHQAGTVKLKNVDAPGTVYTIIGNPFADANEAQKMEPFCLACHDSNGANGQPPFSDGIMPPVINFTLWNGSAHKQGGSAGPVTCAGDGESFGCHANGHGSDKWNLLAPDDASQPPVPGDPLRQQEGMCYSCHDSNGPAGSDIQAEFQLTSRHNVSALDQTDGSRVECRNCHNPHIASTNNALINPDHLKSPWQGNKTDFCLTCHDGQAPTGVAFPPQSPGTGYDKSLYPGTAHAQLSDPGCMNCHEQHGSTFEALMTKKYSLQEQKNYVSSDYSLCWSCHDENQILRQKNAFGSLHKKHVLNEGLSCVGCHDTHGPHDAGEPGLINFAYALKNGFNLRLQNGHDLSSAFTVDIQRNQGACYLDCHGENHNPKKYKRQPLN